MPVSQPQEQWKLSRFSLHLVGHIQCLWRVLLPGGGAIGRAQLQRGGCLPQLSVELEKDEQKDIFHGFIPNETKQPWLAAGWVQAVLKMNSHVTAGGRVAIGCPTYLHQTECLAKTE